MVLDLPEDEIIALIYSLEADRCETPKSNGAEVTPRTADESRWNGINLKRIGRLRESNEQFAEMFYAQDSISTDALWSWAKTLLLAKDFRHAQLLMHAEFANSNRGTTLFNPFEWINLHMNLPELSVDYLFDGSKPGYQIYGLNYLDNPQQVIGRIAEYGGNDGFWLAHYTWSPDDYLEFTKYFSPLAVLSADGKPYLWSADKENDLVDLYNHAYQTLIAQFGENGRVGGVARDAPLHTLGVTSDFYPASDLQAPTSPHFHSFKGVSSSLELNMNYVSDIIHAAYGDFMITQETLSDLSNTIDLVKQDAMLGANDIELSEGARNNCRMLSLSRFKDVQADPAEQEITVQAMRNYFLMRAIHFNRKQLEKALSLGGEANCYSYYKGLGSFPIIEACMSGSLEMVMDLIEAGADVNSTKRNGESALATAVSYNNYYIAKALLDRNADPNIEARRGLSPLSQAGNSRMVDLLIARGADPNIPDADGDLPIVPLIISGYEAGAVALYKAGTDMEHRNRKGVTARNYFRQHFGYDIVR